VAHPFPLPIPVGFERGIDLSMYRAYRKTLLTVVAALALWAAAAGPARAWWTYLEDRGTPLNSYYLGDKLTNIFDFAVNQDTTGWTIDYGLGTTTGGSGWQWRSAAWSHLDNNDRYWESKANEHTFSSTGSWYYSGRFISGGTTEYASDDWLENRTTLSATSYFTVNALSNPSSPSATKDGTYPTGRVDLAWTLWNGKSVMIVRRKGQSVAWSPSQGTSYANGQDQGSDTVVVRGSDGGTSYEDSGLVPGWTYYYKFYSENYSYYSDGTEVNVTLDRPTTVTWDGGGADNGWMTDTNWAADRYPQTGTGVTLNFDGSTRTSPSNDFAAASDFGSIFFNSGASSFTLLGNAIDVASKIENNSSSAQTISNNIVNIGASDLEINPVDGDLTLEGTVDNGGSDIIVYSDDTSGSTLALNGIVSGNGKLIIRQQAIVKMGAASTYSGDTDIEEGELWFEAGSDIGSSTIDVGGSDQASVAKLWISDSDGGTTVTNAVLVHDGNANTRTIGGLNSSGENTFSGNIDLGDDLIVRTENDGDLTLSGTNNLS